MGPYYRKERVEEHLDRLVWTNRDSRCSVVVSVVHRNSNVAMERVDFRRDSRMLHFVVGIGTVAVAALRDQHEDSERNFVECYSIRVVERVDRPERSCLETNLVHRRTTRA